MTHNQSLAMALRAVLTEIAQLKLDRLHPRSIQAQHAQSALEQSACITPWLGHGPWSNSGAVVELSPGHRVVYVHRGAEVVAQVWRPENGTDQDTKALADQISANPDLLAACQAVHDADGDRNAVARAMRMVAAAIDKAHGPAK